LPNLDILGALERTFSLIVNVLEPLVSNDVLGGLVIVLVLLVVLGRGER